MMRSPLIPILALAFAAAPLYSQQAEVDARWLPWVGCWQVEGGGATEAAAARGVFGETVCIGPTAEGVEVASVGADAEVARRTLVADGARRPLVLGGCEGWESAEWSADEDRLFLRSELTCPGGVVRASSGMALMLPGEVWLDVHGVDARGERTLAVRRYRPIDAGELARAGVREPVTEELALAVATTRRAVAAALSVNDVLEASARVAPEVLQAALVERGEGFSLDARTLVRLAEAGVGGEVTDLMIALTWPERFAIHPGAQVRVAAVQPAEGDALARDPWSDPWRRYDPFYVGGYGYGYDRYGYDRYGYGSRWLPGTWRLGSGPVLVVRERDLDSGGRMVKGRGYSAESGTRAGSAGSRGTGLEGMRAPARGSDRGAAVGASSGGSQSGKATGRTAKPRSGNEKKKNHE